MESLVNAYLYLIINIDYLTASLPDADGSSSTDL